MFGLKAICITVFTLGFGLPWAITMYQRLIADTTFANIPINRDEMHAEYDKEASALAEGIGEAGEALEAIGELFG